MLFGGLQVAVRLVIFIFLCVDFGNLLFIYFCFCVHVFIVYCARFLPMP